MKKAFCCLVFLFLCIGGCGENAGGGKATAELRPDRIYFFYSNTCPHCHEALNYIERRYPSLAMEMVNVGNPAGYGLLLKCAQKFKLGRNIGTPLFCMGDNYLMGWTPAYEARFDVYVQPYRK